MIMRKGSRWGPRPRRLRTYARPATRRQEGGQPEHVGVTVQFHDGSTIFAAVAHLLGPGVEADRQQRYRPPLPLLPLPLGRVQRLQQSIDHFPVPALCQNSSGLRG